MRQHGQRVEVVRRCKQGCAIHPLRLIGRDQLVHERRDLFVRGEAVFVHLRQQRGAHRGDVRVPLAAALRHRLDRDARQAPTEPFELGVRRLLGHDRALDVVVVFEGRLAGEHGVEDRAEGVDVGGRAGGGLAADHLLRGEVGGVAVLARLHQGAGAVAGDAAEPVEADDQGGRPEAAVYDRAPRHRARAFVVGVVHAIAGVGDDAGGDPRRKLDLLGLGDLEGARQGLAVAKRHDPRPAFFEALEPEDADDVGVAELGDERGLSLQASDLLVVAGDGLRHPDDDHRRVTTRQTVEHLATEKPQRLGARRERAEHGILPASSHSGRHPSAICRDFHDFDADPFPGRPALGMTAVWWTSTLAATGSLPTR